MPRNYYRAEINRLDGELLRERLRREQAENREKVLRDALQPFARLQIPEGPKGIVGVLYSIRHEDIKAARNALATDQSENGKR